ncbi:DUF4166 domain-containing protein [Halobacteriales archaeon QH_3_68_24]|jgi:hypothetical protein|nr:MAG: DUF4166 domain-containing protein [Halobacteriales archaeon QH_3_68_24]PSP78638.1 MAG: DUF4166 domain-containing protein [Halobacteriales archaeon QH_6_68_27]PSP91680.1 MAG: DUF4166 domain-containing protein [Halobacteriales archaeon QH_8_68_33]
MTGVYEHALGDAADDLHPRVRERYGIGPDDGVACVGRGRMDIDNGTLALPALYAMPARDLLFPETGTDVPFTVTTVGYRIDGYEALTTRRTFDFGDRQRRFDSVTVRDHENERLLDFLGRGGLIASELRPRVEDGALVVGGGRQWTRLGSRYLGLPGPLAADVEVRDRYDEGDERFHVTATVTNPLTGRILRYRGTFTQEFEDWETVPEEYRPTRLTSLPPR